MSLFGRLAEKSWETTGPGDLDPADYRPEAARVGLWVYFGVIVILFGLITSAYVVRMGDTFMIHGPTTDWRAMPEPPLIWVNSFILLVNSLAWEAARIAARRANATATFAGLLGAGLIAFLFLAGQLGLWGQYAALGYFAASNPANAFFYLITALHGLHILGGLFFWSRALSRLLAGAETGAVRLSVELCAAYWHFLLLVWLLMLGLLIST